MRAGVAMRDITPPPGLPMCGFAARTAVAQGAHDPLTARAVAVGDTALLCADVIGFHEDSAARIRARCTLPSERVIVAATHTHGGPMTMPGRLGGGVDAAYLAQLEAACVEAINAAAASQVPVRIESGVAPDPGVARNRRHAGGPVDGRLPVIRLRRLNGAPLATILSYACHPVVLGPDNLLWTADYPGVVRRLVEAAEPGTMALFVTGCAGDANTGHTAASSLTGIAAPDRNFAAAEAVGKRIAACVTQARMTRRDGPVHAASITVPLDLVPAPAPPLDSWRRAVPHATPARAALLRLWIAWGERVAGNGPPWLARVTVLGWAGVHVLGLPGEVFAATASALHAGIDDLLIAGYAEGNPGYIPPAADYAHGGYELKEAHRFYGMPGPFASGSAERLVTAAAEFGDGAVGGD